MNEDLKLRQKELVKQNNDLLSELGAKDKNKFQENFLKSLNNNLSWNFVENLRKRRTPVDPRNAEECV